MMVEPEDMGSYNELVLYNNIEKIASFEFSSMDELGVILLETPDTFESMIINFGSNGFEKLPNTLFERDRVKYFQGNFDNCFDYQVDSKFSNMNKLVYLSFNGVGVVENIPEELAVLTELESIEIMHPFGRRFKTSRKMKKSIKTILKNTKSIDLCIVVNDYTKCLDS